MSDLAGAVRVRRAAAADIGAVVDLRLEFERITRDSGSMDRAARRTELLALLGPDLASGRLLCWLAEDGGIAVAQAALRLPSASPRSEAEMLNVYTVPEYRRLGLASALVASAIAASREIGLGRITLQPTEDSRRLYERAGFRASGRRMILAL